MSDKTCPYCKKPIPRFQFLEDSAAIRQYWRCESCRMVFYETSGTLVCEHTITAVMYPFSMGKDS